MRKLLLVCFLYLYSTATIAKNLKFKAQVPGMVCQMCVQGMKKNFKSAVNDPKTDVLVDLDKKTVTVTLKKEISEDEIKERVKNAGYVVKSIEWINDKKKK